MSFCSVYQEYLAKNLADKYASLNTQMDKIVHDANAEISSLRSKMSSRYFCAIYRTSMLTDGVDMQLDQENLKRKNEELIQAFREKSRKQLQTQELYDKLKRRAMLGQVQNAASDAVDHTIQASVTASRYVDRTDGRPGPNSGINIAHLASRGGTADWAGSRGSQESTART
jgi:E3 ubiquitin-protein ligase CCNP1IP1